MMEWTRVEHKQEIRKTEWRKSVSVKSEFEGEGLVCYRKRKREFGSELSIPSSSFGNDFLDGNPFGSRAK
jgi:hypothetical protein